jgi:YkoY family integral membrane protein
MIQALSAGIGFPDPSRGFPDGFAACVASPRRSPARPMDAIIQFLNLDQFVPGDLLVVAVLVVLEGLLSCDNAVVLALLVKDLPPEQRGKALRYGIIGAYVFRIIALMLATIILKVWWLKVLGGLYLAWLSVDFLRKRFARGGCGDGHGQPRQVRRILGLSLFWSTVVWVELTDIVFSVDSIAAAVALSSKLWVLILGGLLGILAMRFAAQGFVKLLERFPGLETAAFVAVGVIGFKLLAEFPVDVAGAMRPLPAGAQYASAAEYSQQVERHCPSALTVPHVLNLNLAAPPPPELAAMRAGAEAAAAQEAPAAAGGEREAWIARRAERELAEAEARWSLHYRPFLEIEGWASSLVVLLIFAAGFLRQRRGPPAAQPG